MLTNLITVDFPREIFVEMAGYITEKITDLQGQAEYAKEHNDSETAAEHEDHAAKLTRWLNVMYGKGVE